MIGYIYINTHTSRCSDEFHFQLAFKYCIVIYSIILGGCSYIISCVVICKILLLLLLLLFLLLLLLLLLLLRAGFWLSEPLPSIFFYPGQGSSNLALLTSISLLTSSFQRIFGLPFGLFEMGFQE